MSISSIRRQLSLSLLVPILAVVALAAFSVVSAHDRVRDVKRDSATALAAGGPSTLITSLMDERNISAVELLGLAGVVNLRVEDSHQAASETDRHLDQFEATIAASDPEIQAIYGPALEATRASVNELRTKSWEFSGTRDMKNLFADEVYLGYSDVIVKFHTANDAAVARIDDAEMRNRARSVANQSVTSDYQSQLSRFTALSTLRPEGATRTELLQAQGFLTMWERAGKEAVSLLEDDPEAQKVVAGFYGRPNQKEFQKLVEQFLLTGQSNPTEVITQAADDAHPNGADAWSATHASIQRRSGSLIGSAEQARTTTIAIVLLALGVTVAVAVIASRSLSRPLLRLAEQAHDMSSRRLPEAVNAVLSTPLGSDIEIPDLAPIQETNISEVNLVADALNSVQNRALALAVEQAGMRHNISDSFLNMGRRVQQLVGRQIDFITKMEEAEHSPDELEQLYKLDHLATRIRRNAESLVVLAESGKTAKATYGAPESLVNTVRSAISEVEGYERVDIDVDTEVGIAGSAAGHLSHILAELIENGLSFSPPITRVVVEGEVVPGGYEVRIIDGGIGMAQAAVDTANRRLSGGESFTVAPSKYLGHYVTGSLAQRIGVGVGLERNDLGGITAAVFVPEPVVVFPEPPTPESRDIQPFEVTVDEIAEVPPQPGMTRDLPLPPSFHPDPVADPVVADPVVADPEPIGSLLAASRQVSGRDERRKSR